MKPVITINQLHSTPKWKFYLVFCILVFVLTSISYAQLPSGWQNQDIGNVHSVGSASYSNGIFTVNGSGADIWHAKDQFHFVYKTFSGDGQIVTRIISQENTNIWAKSGVMIRQSLDDSTRNLMIAVTPANSLIFQYRSNIGEGTVNYLGATVQAPYWVKLVRVGNSYSAYASPDGSNWTQVGNSVYIQMGASVFVGLAVTSHDDHKIGASTFDQVQVSSVTYSQLPADWEHQDIGDVDSTGTSAWINGTFAVRGSGLDIPEFQ